MKSRILGSFLVGSFAVWFAARAEEPRDDAKDDAKSVMRDKLGAAEQVLEGLVTNDYPSIRLGSQRLQVVMKHRSWNVLATPQYVQFTEEMKRHSQSLADAARTEDIDAATLAYVRLTLSCVNCHKHVRDVKIADFRPAPKTRVSLTLVTPEN